MISIVIPAYEEYASLCLLLPELQRVLGSVENEIIVVQDGPHDMTRSLCRGLGVRWIYGGDKGLGSAIITGIHAATNDLVIVMDGDGQHPVSAAMEIAEDLLLGHNMVLGTRVANQGMSWIRRAMSYGCGLMTWSLGRIPDPMTGLFGVNKGTFKVAVENGAIEDTWKIALEIAVRSGETPVFVPYRFDRRIAGRSKASLAPARQFLLQLARLYAYKINFARMTKFCVVGTSGLVVNLGLLSLLVEIFGVYYVLAATVSIGVSMLWNYGWNAAWTFRSRGNAISHGDTPRSATAEAVGAHQEAD